MKSPIGATPDSHANRWIAEARAGSNDALDKLVAHLTRRYFAELGGRTLRGMSPANTISDLIQETVLRARERFSVFDKDTFAEFKRWADGIFRNKYRHWMRNHRDRTAEDKQWTIWRAIHTRRNLPDPARRPQGGDDAAEFREEAARAFQIFERELKPNEQYIMRLRLFEGLRFKQIAPLVGSTEDGVTKAYKRALARLKSLVEPDGKN
ncbi:MAG: RNA polymerase sigma factor [Pirellulales bacterium]